jgi:hypothetical protein
VCTGQLIFIFLCFRCAACDPAIQKLLLLPDQAAAATYIGECKCRVGGLDHMELGLLPQGKASKEDLDTLMECPTNKGDGKKKSSKESDESESDSISSTLITLPGLWTLPFIGGVTAAVVAGWYIL